MMESLRNWLKYQSPECETRKLIFQHLYNILHRIYLLFFVVIITTTELMFFTTSNESRLFYYLIELS